jgi:hypothetical protein
MTKNNDKKYYKIESVEPDFYEFTFGVDQDQHAVCDSNTLEETKESFDQYWGVTVEEISEHEAEILSSEYDCNFSEDEYEYEKEDRDSSSSSRATDYYDYIYISIDEDQIDYEDPEDIMEIIRHEDEYFRSIDDYVKKAVEAGTSFTPSQVIKISKKIVNELTMRKLIEMAEPKFKAKDYEKLSDGWFSHLRPKPRDII